MQPKYFGRGKGSEKPYSFHSITGPLMMAGRCLGLFPVRGLLDPNPENVRFTVISPYSLICLASIVGQVIFVVLALLHLYENFRVPNYLYSSIWGMSSLTYTLLIIFKLARDWPLLVQKAAVIERSLPKCYRRNATTTCNLMVALVFLTALANIGLYINFLGKFSAACLSRNSLLESYYIISMSAQSTYLPYSTWTFVLLQIVNFQMTFTTIFLDVLLAVVSLYLTSHFEELNDMIVLYRHKYPTIWHVIRSHYAKLIRFVKLVDDTMSYFVLVSFGVNFNLICLHLYKILRKTENYAEIICQHGSKIDILASWDRTIYYLFSFTALVTRTMIVAFSAARLHSASRASISVLYDVPTSCYNIEMAASILTYEIILLQFSNFK